MIWRVVVLLAVAFVAVSADAATQRSYKARAEFAREHPCPATGRPSPRRCTGYVIDHVVPLCAGGADSSGNMQWQTTAEAKKKDREERAQCRKK